MEEHSSSRRNIHDHHRKSWGQFGFHILLTLELKKKQNKKTPQKPPTTQLKSLLPKKSRTQGQQQTLPAFYTLHTFAEERLPTGAEKFVNGKKNHLTLMDSLKC